MGRRAISVLLLALMIVCDPRQAAAGECSIVKAEFVPAESPNPDPGLRRRLSIVAWVEEPNGTYRQTLFITQQVGTYGLGNRPGRFDFNSGPSWPYGKRTTVFPVWAHRKLGDGGQVLQFPEVLFQDGNENNLSHLFVESSRDPHYCKPLQRSEPAWDAATCPTMVYTDKGIFSAGTSLYPPRRDVARQPGTDSSSVAMYAMLNPFDAVSMASPPSDMPATVTWPLTMGATLGNFVLWIEVGREFDHNATYSVDAYPSPMNIPYMDWGEAYRGQPSIVYKVPFTVSATDTVSSTADYAGYGDPDGVDGDLRSPDGTITTDTPGSGAGRFKLVSDQGELYRVRVTSHIEHDDVAPSDPAGLDAETTSRAATVSFIAPGDDGQTGPLRGYDIRYRVGDDITEANFVTSLPLPGTVVPVAPGEVQTFELDKLLPETDYSIAIRALDDCNNVSNLSTLRFTTQPRVTGEVDACFVATAAYGSLLANDVEMLRRFRDLVLHKSVLGELFVESYYTFGPAVAGVVGESDILRASARAVLLPLVTWVKAYRL